MVFKDSSMAVQEDISTDLIIVERQEKKALQQQNIPENKNIMSNYHKTRLKDLVRDRLAESGWIDEMRAVCRGIIKERELKNVTEESLVEEMTQKAEAKLWVVPFPSEMDRVVKATISRLASGHVRGPFHWQGKFENCTKCNFGTGNSDHLFCFVQDLKGRDIYSSPLLVYDFLRTLGLMDLV
ncbi:hypothetical protein TNCV_4271621 [Trichonephila clavipes]|nr:hypothetical protein TNCV_4271621 [Trichonephila clavipes]